MSKGTTTTTKNARVPDASRVYDYLYDPNYTVSSQRDHTRTMIKAATKPDMWMQVPRNVNMFSALNHFPRVDVRLKASDPVPPFVDKTWQGRGSQLYQEMENYSRQTYDPNFMLPKRVFAKDSIEGSTRYRYFRRPIIPYITSVAPEVILAKPSVESTMDSMQSTTESATRTIGTQSMYRESESQTDPYTPEYTVKPGTNHEILTLANCSYNQGLPAGLAEIEMIERARARRAWEASLPPLSEPGAFDQRRRMMEEMELMDWREREEEIERLQSRRLEVLADMLKKREDETEKANNERIERIWQARLKEKQGAMERIEKKRIKGMRHIKRDQQVDTYLSLGGGIGRRSTKNKSSRRCIISDYANHSSFVWAPTMRNGVFQDKDAARYKYDTDDLNSFEKLVELEQSLPQFVLKPQVRAPVPGAKKAKTPKERRERVIQAQLAQMELALKAKRNTDPVPEKPLKYCIRIEKPPVRPKTPSVPDPAVNDERRTQAIVLLQRLIRGRAVQNNVFNGKERRLELIAEIRSTHILQESKDVPIEDIVTARAHTIKEMQQKKESEGNARADLEAVKSELRGKAVGDTLSFLSKELVRLQEQRRISAMVALAERQRRMREAEESGRREEEVKRRTEQDEIFRQVMKVHQGTVETYLERILMDSLERTTDEEARSYINDQAGSINKVITEMDKVQTPEKVVTDLVHAFLLPEVEKQTLRQKVTYDQHKFLMASHLALKEGVNKADVKLAAEAEDADRLRTLQEKKEIEEAE